MQREGTREVTLQVCRRFVHALAACISEQTWVRAGVAVRE